MKLGVLCNTINKTECYEVEKDLADMAQDIKNSLVHSHDVIILNADKDLSSKIKDHKIDFIFNICERFNDNSLLEPHVAAMLEMLNIPFTGSDHHTLAVCNNKIRSKEILTANNILTPRYQVFHSPDDKLDSGLDFPLIVKPRQQENSIGITQDSIINDKQSLKNKIKEIKERFNQESLVEKFIPGEDIEIGIIGNDKDITILSPAKVHYKKLNIKEDNKIFCYESKWDKNSEKYGDYTLADLDQKILARLEKISKKVFRIFNIKDYGRVDFRVSKEGVSYVIEVTANPGLSRVCSTPQAAEWSGIRYKELINKILEAARKRYYETDN